MLFCFPGSPFKFTVIDASQVTATGEGLGLVPCNRSTGFAVHAPGARAQDLTVNILGMNIIIIIYNHVTNTYTNPYYQWGGCSSPVDGLLISGLLDRTHSGTCFIINSLISPHCPQR